MKVVKTSVAALTLAGFAPGALAQDVCDGRGPAPVLECPAEVEITLDATCDWQAGFAEMAPAYPMDAPGMACRGFIEGHGTGARVGRVVCEDTCNGDAAQSCDVPIQPVDLTPPTIQVNQPDVTVYLAEGATQRLNIEEACGIVFEDNCTTQQGSIRGIDGIISDHPDEVIVGAPGSFQGDGISADWFSAVIELDPAILGERTYTVGYHMDDTSRNRETVECRIHVIPPACQDHVPAELMCFEELEVEVDQACDWRVQSPEQFDPDFPHDRDGMACSVWGQGHGLQPGRAALRCEDSCDDTEQRCDVDVQPIDNLPPVVQVTEPVVTLEQREGALEWARIEALCGITFEDNCTPPEGAIRGIHGIETTWAAEEIMGEPGDFRGLGIIADWFSARFDLDPRHPARTYTVTYHMDDNNGQREVVQCEIRIVPPSEEPGDPTGEPPVEPDPIPIGGGDGFSTPPEGGDEPGDGSATPGDGEDEPGDGSATPGEGDDTGDGIGDAPAGGAGGDGIGEVDPMDAMGSPTAPIFRRAISTKLNVEMTWFLPLDPSPAEQASEDDQGSKSGRLRPFFTRLFFWR